uniref:Uncharacterized protein n=1 Tax=Sipha flava TaxID=143950 RepID=A0A2S2QB62_9HEMI
MCYVMIFVLVSYDKKILFFIMILRSLKIICIVVLKSAILIAIFRKMIEKDLYQSFEHNMNLSFCVVCLRNYSTCNTFDFQLDYKRHADYDQYFNYVSMFVLSTIRLINILVSQPNHKIFFGALEFKNGIVVHTVAKVSGYYNSSKLKQMINTSTYIDPTVLENELNLILPNNADDYSLYICSKNDTNSYSLKYNILSSVIDDKNRNNSQLWLEAWVAAHFNAEPVILKYLYRY